MTRRLESRPRSDKAEQPARRKRAGWQQALAEAGQPGRIARELGWPEEVAALLEGPDHGFDCRATRHYLSLVDPRDPEDPILRQIRPDNLEGAPQPPGFSDDAVGDLLEGNAPVPGMVHKYTGRALLVTTGACAVNCRFCFRRNYPYGSGQTGGPGRREAVTRIEADESITEVILSGGDPLSLSDARLRDLCSQLARIPHVRRLRIHTRMPVLLPDRITDSLCGMLAGLAGVRVWVVTHFNHPRELADGAIDACWRLIEHGIPVLNQSVLLRGVNDRAGVLAELNEGLLNVGIKPYYLHQLDKVSGTAHFEVPEEEGRSLLADLRTRVSGLAMPAWVRDLPGGASKTVLSLLLLLALLACTPPEPSSPSIRKSLAGRSATDVQPIPGPQGPEPLPSIDFLLAADLDGDLEAELLAGSGRVVQWGHWPDQSSVPLWEGRYESAGLLQAWTAADFDDDGREEVIAAFGMGRGATEAPLELVLLDRKAGSTVVARIWGRRGSRNQVTALAPWPKVGGGADLYIAAFSDRFTVQGGLMTLGAASPRWLEGHTLRLGMARAVGDFDGDGQVEVAVGRLYGDEPDGDGDLRVLHGDGREEMIPTLRGVRAMGSGDVDGDGFPEILFGDGWHKNYGKLARFRPNIAHWNGSGWGVQLVEERTDQYSVESIGLIAGMLVAGGNTALRIYERSGEAWVPRPGSLPSSRQGAWTALGETLVAGGQRPVRLSLTTEQP